MENLRMYKILDNLATHGIREGILKGYSESKQGLIDRIVDVRTLIDGS